MDTTTLLIIIIIVVLVGGGGWSAEDAGSRLIAQRDRRPRPRWAALELQRLSASPECAVRYLEAVGDLDVRELLSHLRARTLVMHVRDDPRMPLQWSLR